MVGFRTTVKSSRHLYRAKRSVDSYNVSKPAGRQSARDWFLLSATPVLLGALLAGNTAPASRSRPIQAELREPPAFYCTNPQRTSTVQGNPHVAAVPELASVSLQPNSGGLRVSFKFRKPIVFAPEGVYLSWTVFLYRNRGAASNYEGGVRLQFQDRGKGWQPTGWTILAVVGSTNNLLSGQVHTNRANNELTTFFPGGLANLRPPFYWFATQEEYRAYLPVGTRVAARDWKVYGAVFTDCPAGVRPDPDSSPYATRLLTAGG